jgi:hypothetical protein
VFRRRAAVRTRELGGEDSEDSEDGEDGVDGVLPCHLNVVLSAGSLGHRLAQTQHSRGYWHRKQDRATRGVRSAAKST